MSDPHLRFVHASDLHLDSPLDGIAEIPPHLSDALVDAPIRAAEKVFDTVIEEDAEFLILSGDVLAADRAGPREILFLADQFERLADKKIRVYWLASRSDPTDDWSSAGMFPDNVVRLPAGENTELIYQRRQKPDARIVAFDALDGQAIDSVSSANEVVTIGIARSAGEPLALEQQPVDYWALGGRAERRTVTSEPMTIQFSGSPQGRHPSETGAHGCTVVDITPSHAVSLTHVTTDVVRWHAERLEIDASVDTIQLELQARQRLQYLLANHADQILLISFSITGHGPLLGELRRGNTADDVVAKLRTEFGHHTPAVWTVALTAEPRHDFPTEWYEEETMLGEFLRNVRELTMTSSEKIDLAKYLDPLPAELAAQLEIRDTEDRAAVLQRAATLGAELLSGDPSRAGRSH